MNWIRHHKRCHREASYERGIVYGKKEKELEVRSGSGSGCWGWGWGWGRGRWARLLIAPVACGCWSRSAASRFLKATAESVSTTEVGRFFQCGIVLLKEFSSSSFLRAWCCLSLNLCLALVQESLFSSPRHSGSIATSLFDILYM